MSVSPKLPSNREDTCVVTALVEEGGTLAARASDESVSSKQALELVAPDLRAHVCHQVGHELYVVQREEPVDGRLLCAPQVVQIGAGVVSADEASHEASSGP